MRKDIWYIYVCSRTHIQNKEVLKISQKMTDNSTEIWASDLNKHFKPEDL